MQGISFTSRYDGMSNVLKNNVKINPKQNCGDESFQEKEWIALWDTGATTSVITNSVVNELQLKPVSMQTIYTPSGQSDVYMYYIDLLLPNGLIVPNLLVCGAQPAGCDILIGMDIISHGDFAVSNINQKTSFTFRIPSMLEFDFVNKSYLEPIVKTGATPGRNSPCPCGSGKKWKQCCGKNS